MSKITKASFTIGGPIFRNVLLRVAVVALFVPGATFLVGCGGGSSTTTVVSTVTAPVITTQPTAQTALVGAAVTFSVTATGTSLHYQWYKGGSAISGATASAYTIASVAATDTGSYDVIVSNSAGTVTSTTITLTVSASTGSANVTTN